MAPHTPPHSPQDIYIVQLKSLEYPPSGRAAAEN